MTRFHSRRFSVPRAIIEGPGVNSRQMSTRQQASAEKRECLAGRRILIIVENLPVPFDRRVWQEARALREAGASVSIICPTGKGYEKREEIIEGIKIYRHPLPIDASSPMGYLREYASALLWETFLSWKVFFREGFDVIHACNPPDLIFLVALQFKLLGKRFVFDHHDINPELYEAKFKRRDGFWRLLLFLERMTFRQADVSIATNDSYRRIAIERGNMKPDDVFVVRSGPDLSRINPVAVAPERKNGRKYLVGYVGVIGAQEGVDLLLDAAKHIVHDLGRNDIQFCIVGGGPALDELRQSASEDELDDFVTFLGRAPDADLLEVLSTSDICVNPDRVNEMNSLSTMNKVLEYMALGKPIVQFDVIEGRVSAQGASLYARANDPKDFAEKIIELLSDAEARQAMGQLGRQRVETGLSWSHQAPRLIEAYQRLFADDKRSFEAENNPTLG